MEGENFLRVLSLGKKLQAANEYWGKESELLPGMIISGCPMQRNETVYSQTTKMEWAGYVCIYLCIQIHLYTYVCNNEEKVAISTWEECMRGVWEGAPRMGWRNEREGRSDRFYFRKKWRWSPHSSVPFPSVCVIIQGRLFPKSVGVPALSTICEYVTGKYCPLNKPLFSHMLIISVETVWKMSVASQCLNFPHHRWNNSIIFFS